jgi:hypothetical protein
VCNDQVKVLSAWLFPVLLMHLMRSLKSDQSSSSSSTDPKLELLLEYWFLKLSDLLLMRFPEGINLNLACFVCAWCNILCYIWMTSLYWLALISAKIAVLLALVGCFFNYWLLICIPVTRLELALVGCFFNYWLLICIPVTRLEFLSEKGKNDIKKL